MQDFPESHQNGSTPLSATSMKSEPVAIYEYFNVHGVAFEKGRFEPPVGDKLFRWRRKGTNGWPGGSSGAVIEEMPLYGG